MDLSLRRLDVMRAAGQQTQTTHCLQTPPLRLMRCHKKQRSMSVSYCGLPSIKHPCLLDTSRYDPQMQAIMRPDSGTWCQRHGSGRWAQWYPTLRRCHRACCAQISTQELTDLCPAGYRWLPALHTETLGFLFSRTLQITDYVSCCHRTCAMIPKN